jgi:acetyl esterase/lipase
VYVVLALALALAVLSGCLAVAQRRAADEVTVYADVTYVPGSADDKHRMDVYLPKGRTGFPIVHFVHGGYWREGDRRYYPAFVGLYGNVGLALAKRGIGVTVQSYRLSPEVTIDGQLEDVARGVAFTQANAAAWGASTDGIFLAGHSAGGHLAALLSCDPTFLHAAGADPKGVRGTIALSPVLDLEHMRTHNDAAFNAIVTAPVFGTEPERLARFSPSACFRREIPPLQLLLGEHDYPYLVDQVQVQARRLTELGAAATLQVLPGYSHEDMVLEVNGDDDRVTPAIAAFVGR